MFFYLDALCNTQHKLNSKKGNDVNVCPFLWWLKLATNWNISSNSPKWLEQSSTLVYLLYMSVFYLPFSYHLRIYSPPPMTFLCCIKFPFLISAFKCRTHAVNYLLRRKRKKVMLQANWVHTYARTSDSESEVCMKKRAWLCACPPVLELQPHSLCCRDKDRVWLSFRGSAWIYHWHTHIHTFTQSQFLLMKWVKHMLCTWLIRL